MSYRIVTRRAFLSSTAALALAAPLRGECETTPPNIEGPYWRAGAPFTTNLRAGVNGGNQLIVTGRVTSVDGCTPVRGAILDLWQADHQGYYDVDHPGNDSPEKWYLRGRVRAEDDGHYRFETIKPAAYGMGGRLRPAHIHFKIAAPGFRRLTTQLYFEGDPHLDDDPLRAVRAELVKKVERAGNVLSCRFDITLRPA